MTANTVQELFRSVEPRIEGPTDEQLQAEIADIDRMLDSLSSWLTPRCRMALMTARDVVVRVLERRRHPWPATTGTAGTEGSVPWTGAHRRLEH